MFVVFRNTVRVYFFIFIPIFIYYHASTIQLPFIEFTDIFCLVLSSKDALPMKHIFPPPTLISFTGTRVEHHSLSLDHIIFELPFVFILVNYSNPFPMPFVLSPITLILFFSPNISHLSEAIWLAIDKVAFIDKASVHEKCPFPGRFVISPFSIVDVPLICKKLAFAFSRAPIPKAYIYIALHIVQFAEAMLHTIDHISLILISLLIVDKLSLFFILFIQFL